MLWFVSRKQALRPAGAASLVSNGLFENRESILTVDEIASYLNEGLIYLAKYAKDKGRYDEALRLLGKVQTAEAAFESALVRIVANLWKVANQNGS